MKYSLLILAFMALAAGGQDQPDGAGRSRLYTAPDPAAKGGISGRIISPLLPIQQVLAIPPDEPRLVYEGSITGADKRSFAFNGLPMRKYDLIVIYEQHFYEGLHLQRGESTLTPQDHAKITKTVLASEPYFTKKFVHRAEGTTGRGNLARAICTFLRDRSSAEGHWEHRRTFKLIMFKDVGPGWQVVRARDLFPVSIKPDSVLPQHHYTDTLGGIRVSDYMKDLGEIRLTR